MFAFITGILLGSLFNLYIFWYEEKEWLLDMALLLSIVIVLISAIFEVFNWLGGFCMVFGFCVFCGILTMEWDEEKKR